jgi:VWFA-related protein
VRIQLLPVILLIILSVSISFSQQPQASPPPVPQLQPTPPQKPEDLDVVRITTNLVQVDAVVTDKSGKVVTDLKPEEVEIFEDGHRQKITNFSYYEAEATAAASPGKNKTAVDKNAPPFPPNRLTPADVRRTIAIVVDDLGLSFESTYYVRQALKKFVDEQIQTGDLVAIIRTSGGMGALQQFTADKRQLYAAVERVKWNATGRGGIGAFAPIEPPTPGDRGAEIDAAGEDFNRFREDVFAVGTLGAISYVVRGLKELPGRKSILLVSDGFRIHRLDDPNANFLALERLRRLIDQANRAAVVIYTMNATGLQTFGLTAADSTGERSPEQIEERLSQRRNAAWETQEGLDYLARETGGIPIRNTNDLSGGIKKVLEDQRGFYLIGYRPDSSTFDPRAGRRTFHRLSLKVTRPGKFKVRTRNGFYGVTDSEPAPPKSLGQEMYAALTSPFGATGVHLQLTSLFANDAKVGSFMRSVLYIDPHDLTFTDEADHFHKSVFDVLAITFGDNGAPLDHSGKTYTIKLPDEWFRRVLRDGLVYYVTVPIKKPGAYQLRISLRDSRSGAIGSASQFVEVPDLKKNRLALSGLTLSGPPPTQAGPQPAASPADPLTGNQAEQTNASDDRLDNGNAEDSPAIRHFRRGRLMDYGLIIYNARLDKTTNRPQLTTQVRLFRSGKVIFAGQPIPLDLAGQTDLKRLIGAGRIQLGTDLSFGQYILQVVVTDALADEKHRTATQWMDFEIVR